MINRSSSFTFFQNNQYNWESGNLIGLPPELVSHVINMGYDKDPTSEIGTALHLAASGQEDDLVKLAAMIEVNPKLLLQAGDVVTRGGYFAVRKSLYEFFLAEGDPVGAKRIEFGFTKIKDGETVRLYQYEKYRPHINALAKQVESKTPTYDLKPLFDLIIASDSLDTPEMNKAMEEFEKGVELKIEIDDMHYKHFTTLMQAFDLRYERWNELSKNNTNYEKCDFVWQKIIGKLQLNLPAPDRFGFARAFVDEERTVDYKYATGSFPDTPFPAAVVSSGLGFNEAIYGGRAGGHVCEEGCGIVARVLENTYREKTSNLQSLCSPSRGPSLSRA